MPFGEARVHAVAYNAIDNLACAISLPPDNLQLAITATRVFVLAKNQEDGMLAP